MSKELAWKSLYYLACRFLVDSKVVGVLNELAFVQFSSVQFSSVQFSSIAESGAFSSVHEFSYCGAFSSASNLN